LGLILSDRANDKLSARRHTVARHALPLILGRPQVVVTMAHLSPDVAV
jgi:hypothetical protein